MDWSVGKRGVLVDEHLSESDSCRHTSIAEAVQKASELEDQVSAQSERSVELQNKLAALDTANDDMAAKLEAQEMELLQLREVTLVHCLGAPPPNRSLTHLPMAMSACSGLCSPS